jgi:hypothetical protein
MIKNRRKGIKQSMPVTFIFLTGLPVLVSIIVFFMFNMLTPFWWDDFVFSCFFTTWYEPHTVLLSSFSDVAASTYNMYQTWNGRSVANFIIFSFMFLKNKNIFNICNTVVYCIFVLLIGFHVTGSFRKISGLLFMFINILLWLVLPAWGQNLLWLTGSCNYLWESTVILLFLVPFRKKIEDLSYKPHIVVSFLWIITGILAGWSMENSASGVFILLLAYFVLKRRKKEPIMVFEISGSIGFMIGFFMLIHARHNLFPGFWGLIKNIIEVGFSFIIQDGLLLGVIIFLAIELIRFRKTHIAKTAYGFFLAALTSAAAMIIPGYFGGRSVFITQVFLIIALLSLVIQIKRVISGRYVIAAGAALMLAFIPSFYTGSIDIVKSFIIAQARENYILSEKQNGNPAIKVKTPIPVSDPHNGMHGGDDILDDSVGREYVTHNSAKAAWYGIESLDGIPTLRKPGRRATIEKFLDRRKQDGLGINDLLTMIYEDW